MSPKPTITIPADRVREIETSLRDPSLTPTEYLKRAFLFTEVSRVDIFKFKAGQYQASKLEELGQGFDPPEGVEKYLEGKWKPGRFNFRAVIDGSWRGLREYGIGDFEEPPPRVGAGPATREAAHAELDPNQQLAELRVQDKIDELQERRAERERSRLNAEEERQLRTAALLKALTPGQGESQPKMVEKLVEEVIKGQATQIEILREELKDARQQSTATARGPQNSLTELAAPIKAFADVAPLLGFVKADRAKPDDSGGWVEAGARLLEVATPTIERVLNLAEKAIAQRAPTPGTLVPVSPTPGGVVTMAAPTPEQIEQEKRIREVIGFAKEALRSRAFADARYIFAEVLVTPDGAPIVPIDPEASALAHMFRLKLLDPEFDQLRAEFTEFLKFCREQGQKPIETHEA